MKKWLYLILILGIVCSACSEELDQEQQSTLIEPTLTAVPPTSTYTPEPTEIPTDTPVPSPTPDLRIILEKPRELVLLTEDLPEDGKYFISQDRGTLTNEMIVYNFQNKLGEETAGLVDLYLQETSRLDGYSQVWTRGSWAFDGPLYIANEIAVFEDALGAQLEVTKYKPLLIQAMDGRVPSHEDIQIGDETRIYLDTVLSNGQEADIILVEFSHRNVVIDIGCWGEKGKYDLDDVLVIAENVYARLQQLPLSEIEP